MSIGLDEVIDAIVTGGYRTRERKRSEQREIQNDIVNRLVEQQRLNIPQGSSLQEMGRGMDLRGAGIQPQTSGPQLPQPNQAVSQFAPTGPQMPQGSVCPQMGVGGQGPTQLPLNQGQDPRNTQAINHFDLWQQQNQQRQALGDQVQQVQLSNAQMEPQLKQSEIGRNQAESRLADSRARSLSSIDPDTGQPIITPKQRQQDEKSLSQLTRQIDPYIAMRGTLIGTSSKGNARSNRALKITNDSKATPQQLSAAIVDLAGIMANGTPHDLAMRQQNYGTLYTDIANMKTYLESKPQAANQPEVQQNIRQMIKEIVSVDNDVITNNIGIVESMNSDQVGRNRKSWDSAVSKIKKSLIC